MLKDMTFMAMGAGAVLAYQKYSKPMMKKMNQVMKSAKKQASETLEDMIQLNPLFRGFFVNLFDKITLTSEVSRDKSFPDVYLLAAEKLNVSPKDCIVFEDILPAIHGAKSAGMKVIAVNDEPYTPLGDKAKIIKEADIYINDYNTLLNEIKVTI